MLEKIASIDEARKLIVDVTSYVINFLNNSNPGIIPHLSEHPFSPEKVYIQIDLIRNMELDEPLIEVAYFRGVIEYFYEYNHIKVPNETFEEAKAKVLGG